MHPLEERSILILDLVDRLEDSDWAPVDNLQGHLGCVLEQEKLVARSVAHVLLTTRPSNLEMLRSLQTARDAGIPLDSPILVGGALGQDCPGCGEPLLWSFTGTGWSLWGVPCKHPKGLVTTFELNVPSGRMVVADDLQMWYPFEDLYDLNSVLGRHRTTLHTITEQRMAFGFVSNTCPSVFQEGSRFVIGALPEDTQREDPPSPWGVKVGQIITNLWWYSIVDLGEFERRRQKITPDRSLLQLEEDREFEILKVTPGVYQFNHYHGALWQDDDTPLKFATFEWIRKPDPVKDLDQ